MDNPGAIQGNRLDDAPFHQINDHRAKAYFDDMGPKAGGHYLSPSMGGYNRRGNLFKIFRRQGVWKTAEKILERTSGQHWPGKLPHPDLTLPCPYGICLDPLRGNRHESHLRQNNTGQICGQPGCYILTISEPPHESADKTLAGVVVDVQ